MERSADRELLEALLAGESCHVLNSRQMGKSSLAVRTVGRLGERGVRTAFVDLTRLGGATVTPEQWYAGLLMETGRALGLRPEAAAWLGGHRDVGPAQRLLSFLHEEALSRIQGPVVLMVDEIDAVRSLAFSTDELFAGLRQLHNGRASDPALARLAVCLLGAALPGDLVRDPRTTPFNVGRRIELRDFSPEEARPFAARIGEPALARVLRWTGGHPFLTQALCAQLAAGRGEGPGAVDALVRERYLNARAREADTNLADVGNRLLGKGDPDVAAEARADVLSLYERMLRGGDVADDEASPAAARVKMSGVARVEGGRLRVRNRIYREAFGPRWVQDNMPGQELRRQRRAFWKGALRTGLVSAAVLAVVTTLAVVASNAAKQARTAQAEALRERADAQAQATEAQRQSARAERKTREAELAGAAERRTADELKVALDTQKTLGHEAAVAAQDATAQRDVARQKTRLAETNAAEAKRQQSAALEQKRLVLVANRSMAAQLYMNAVASIGPLLVRNERGRIALLVGSLAGQPEKGWEWSYWSRVSQRALDNEGLFTKGSTPERFGEVFVPSEGSGIIVYSAISAYLVDERTGKPIRQLWRIPPMTGGAVYARSAAFSPNGRWAIREDADGRRVVQDLVHGDVRELTSGKVDSEDARILGVSDDGLRYATIARQNVEASKAPLRSALSLTVWDGRSGKPLSRRVFEPRILDPLALSPDGRSALVSFHDSATRRYGIEEVDAESGKTRRTFDLIPPADAGSSLPSFPCNARYAAGDTIVARAGSRLYVFDRGSAAPRFDARVDLVDAPAPLPISVSQDGRLILLTDGARCSIIDGRTGTPRGTILSQGGTLSPNGRLVVRGEYGGLSGSDWRETRLYEDRPLVDPAREDGGVSSSMKRDGTIVVERRRGRPGQPPQLSSATVFDPQGRFRGRYPAAGTLASEDDGILGDGPFIDVRRSKGALEVRRLSDFRLVRTLPIPAGSSVSLNAEGNRAASIDARGTLRVWAEGSAPIAAAKTVFSGHEEPWGGPPFVYPPRVAFSPDGTKLLITDTSHDAQVWDARKLRPLATLAGVAGDNTIEWDQNGKGVLILWQGSGLWRYDLGSKSMDTVLNDSAGNIGRCAFSPDRRLVAIVKGGAVEVWSVQSPHNLFSIDAFVLAPQATFGGGFGGEKIADLAFSPDGRRLSVLYQNGRLRVFEGGF